MEQTRPGLATLHPRLTVTWMDASRRAGLLRSLRTGARAVTAEQFEDRAVALAEQRQEARALETAALLDDLAAVRAERDGSAGALGDLLAERARLLDAATWCEDVPAATARRSAREAELVDEVEELGRSARAAGRQLERVLEQRASAEHALDQARRELTELGVTGVDETGVRRQLEESSTELREASTAYRTSMTELARRRDHLEELEALRGGAVDEVRIDRPSDGSQLDLMRAAIDAKFGSPTAVPRTGDDAVRTAQVAVEAAQREADAAAARLADARTRIASFEEELVRRAESAGAVDARREAAAALDAQVASLERRLTEAESSARHEVDETTRALNRTEHELDQLRQDRREADRRLRSLIASVASTDLPADPDDSAVVGEHVAAALRAEAAVMDPEIGRTGEAVDALDARVAALQGELDRLRAGRGGVTATDRGDALVAYALLGDDVLVLDDAVSADADGVLTVVDLDAAEIDTPVVVLTSEADVVGWAIELPDDRGQVLSAAVVAGVLADDPADPDPSPASNRPTRTTMECSS